MKNEGAVVADLIDAVVAASVPGQSQLDPQPAAPRGCGKLYGSGKPVCGVGNDCKPEARTFGIQRVEAIEAIEHGLPLLGRYAWSAIADRYQPELDFAGEDD